MVQSSVVNTCRPYGQCGFRTTPNIFIHRQVMAYSRTQFRTSTQLLQPHLSLSFSQPPKCLYYNAFLSINIFLVAFQPFSSYFALILLPFIQNVFSLELETIPFTVHVSLFYLKILWMFLYFSVEKKTQQVLKCTAVVVCQRKPLRVIKL